MADLSPTRRLSSFSAAGGGEDEQWEEFFDSLPPAAIEPPEVAEAETDEH